MDYDENSDDTVIHVLGLENRRRNYIDINFGLRKNDDDRIDTP